MGANNGGRVPHFFPRSLLSANPSCKLLPPLLTAVGGSIWLRASLTFWLIPCTLLLRLYVDHRAHVRDILLYTLILHGEFKLSV